MPGGRPPLPTKVLQLRGTHRPDRHGQPADETQLAPVTVLPRPPRFLGRAGKQEWRRIGPGLIEKGLLSQGDLAAFAGYCAALSRAVDADYTLQLLGLTMVTLQGVLPRPEVAIARTSWAEVRRFAQEFGLTPSGRRRVSQQKVEKPADPVGDFLFGVKSGHAG